MEVRNHHGSERGKVLLVDDEPALLRALSRRLRNDGWDVETAESGAAAVRRLEAEVFDVVVSDVSMPGMNGMDVLRAVRSRDEDVPVVLMTGSPQVETAVQAVELGALRYLLKPFDDTQLLDAVGQAAKLHSVARLKRAALDLAGRELEKLGDRATLEAALERALAGLWMSSQPIVSLQGMNAFAHETLLRTSEQRLANPVAFIDAAERLGKLTHLGRLIRSRVAASVAQAPALVFVNLHPSDLLDEALYDANAPLSKVASRVVLEITERATVESINDMHERAAALRKIGFKIALDDLGAGFAGLGNFARLQPDFVKLDRSLVDGIDGSSTKTKLVASLAGVCRELQIGVIAEGVERAEEEAVLRDAGIDLLQGYRFSKPERGFPQPRFV